jgi:malonyl-CoA/methylmalonyl-CoA synthetase
MNELPLIARARSHAHRTAIIDSAGQHTYGELLDASAAIATALLDGADDLEEARVAFLVAPGFEYAAVQWGIWRAGGVAVPLAVSHPEPELEYTITDSDASVIIAQPGFADRLRPIAERRASRFIMTGARAVPATSRMPAVEPDRRAMILYTSGTTSRPKGVVTTHANIRAQVETLINAWGWTSEDHILLVLPLHHVHGIINVVTCALWAGGTCTVHAAFDADATWRALVEERLTLFMAVPTVYGRLIRAWEAAPPGRREAMSEACRSLRLMVSGSAALPVSVLEQWRKISGHTLLERYGMTEIGMAISNPLQDERRPGHVGTPLPGVEVRLVDESGTLVEPGTPGEIEVKGPSVFREYWRRPNATRQAFRDSWFRTGDVAVVEKGYYRILGRNSVDILKTGGYKVSALEIEEVLRTHPTIEECAVVGVEDPDLGERVCAALVLRPGTDLSMDDLRAWAAERLAPYKVPREMRRMSGLPRNAMGKVTKPEVSRLFTG